MQHALIQSGLCHHSMRGMGGGGERGGDKEGIMKKKDKTALDFLRQGIEVAHPLPSLSWLLLNSTIHGFKVHFLTFFTL